MKSKISNLFDLLALLPSLCRVRSFRWCKGSGSQLWCSPRPTIDPHNTDTWNAYLIYRILISWNLLPCQHPHNAIWEHFDGFIPFWGGGLSFLLMYDTGLHDQENSFWKGRMFWATACWVWHFLDANLDLDFRILVLLMTLTIWVILKTGLMSSTATRILSHIIQAFIFNVLTMVVDMYFSSPQIFLNLFHCTFDLQHLSPFSIIFPTVSHHFPPLCFIFHHFSHGKLQFFINRISPRTELSEFQRLRLVAGEAAGGVLGFSVFRNG